MDYSRIIIIGFGKIALECLKIVKGNFEGDIDFVKLEKDFLAGITKEDRVNYHFFESKKEVTNFFLTISDKTLVISANNNYLFSKKVIDKENFFIINFHNALLPAHRGRNAQTWAIFNRDVKTGITWHVVNERVDDGNIVFQEEYSLKGTETAIFLTKKLMELGITSFEKIFPDLLNDNLKFKKQKKIGNYGKIHYSYDIPNKGILNLSSGIKEMSAFLRSVDYGIANIFPKPKVKILSEEREIRKYKLFQMETHENFSIRMTSEDEIEIVELNNKLILYLTKNERTNN